MRQNSCCEECNNSPMCTFRDGSSEENIIKNCAEYNGWFGGVKYKRIIRDIRQIDQLQAENERLKEALVRIAKLNHNWDAESVSFFVDITLKIAEQALQGKEGSD